MSWSAASSAPAEALPGRSRILTVVGNRPQFVKAAAVSAPLRAVADETLVHTGQHHDSELSDVFFDELGIPAPDVNLGIQGGGDADQVDAMAAALRPIIAQQRPDWVLLYGDTNSTLAGALAAEAEGSPVAHVEAGMRSFDLSMTEERNRIATDQRSQLLLCSTPVAVANLEREGITGRVELVGDVMADVVELVSHRVAGRTGVLERAGVAPGQYLLVTAHRAANVDTPGELRRLVGLLGALPERSVLPLHPRTAARLDEFGLMADLKSIARLKVIPPVGYLDFQSLLLNSTALLTDSGGAQKEAYLNGIRCVTLRDSTEWTETVDAGWNTLVGLDAVAAVEALLTPSPADRPELYGDGHAGDRVVAALILGA